MHWSRQRWPARPNRLRHRHHCGSGSADGRDPSAGREDWTQRSTNIEHLKRANKVDLFKGHFEHGVALFSPRVYSTLQKNARSWWPPNLDQNNGDIWLFICLLFFVYLFCLSTLFTYSFCKNGRRAFWRLFVLPLDDDSSSSIFNIDITSGKGIDGWRPSSEHLFWHWLESVWAQEWNQDWER